MTSLDKTIINQLVDFGLTEKEAVVYLTAIESGVLTVQQLSRNSGVNRSSTYMALESLTAKGLVGKSFNEARVGVYEAFEPDILLKKAAEKEREQIKIHEEIDSLVPELTSLSTTLVLHPRVKFYEGTGGIETTNHDLSELSPKEKVRIFMPNPVSIKSKNGQVVQVISPHQGDRVATPNKSVSIHLVPAKKYNFSSEIRIYGDKIVLISEREQFATIIEDKFFAEVMKETFDLAWGEAKRLNSKIRNR